MSTKSILTNLPSIFLIGPMGAGKSTLGRLLAQELKRPFYDSDQVIEERCGAAIPWIFDIEGEEGFRVRESQVIDELTQLDHIVLATGGGAILKPENREWLHKRGKVVFLQTTVDQQLERTAKSKHRPLLHTPDPRARLETLRQAREPLYLQTAHFIIPTDERPPRQVMLDIKQQLFSDTE